MRKIEMDNLTEKPIYFDEIYLLFLYMLEAVSLDQLRVFIAAAETGSFSAAGRKVRRAQSLVSQALANLESQLGVRLFDRTKKYPKLTNQGEAMLVEAKAVIDRMDELKARAKTMAEGLEPELAAVVDVMYPMSALTKAVGFFKEAYPRTPLLLYVEALGAVAQAVLDRRCRVGVIGSLPNVPDALESEPLIDVSLVTVVAPHHALAQIRGTVPKRRSMEHVQLVLTDRSTLSEGRTFGVLSPLTWRLADLGAKLEFLRAGFGWGHMPLPLVQDALVRKELVRIRLEGVPANPKMPMHAVYRKDAPPGPAGRAFIEQLRKS
jgi:DNA-binding transcriptional LysR family regulator